MRTLNRSVKIRLIMMLAVGLVVFTPIAAIKLNKHFKMLEVASKSIPPVAVTAVKAIEAEWETSMPSVGTMVAEQGIEVTAPLPGTTIKIHFESGQSVQKGDPLISQDVGVPEAELSGLRATLKLRQSQFRRSSKLFSTKQISRSDLDDSAALLEEAKAAVLAKSAFITRKTVYAPFDGVLGIRMIDLGSYLEPGDPIVPLYTQDPIHVDYALPEKFISRIFSGQSVEVVVSAYPSRTFTGKVSAYDPVIDSDTRNVKIRATIRNGEGLLRPGMFAEVSTIDDSKRKVIVLPDTALSYSPFGNTLFIIKNGTQGMMVQKEQVQIGQIQGRYVEVLRGIDAGDMVVAVGQNKLRNGMLVSVSDMLSVASED